MICMLFDALIIRSNTGFSQKIGILSAWKLKHMEKTQMGQVIQFKQSKSDALAHSEQKLHDKPHSEEITVETPVLRVALSLVDALPWVIGFASLSELMRAFL